MAAQQNATMPAMGITVLLSVPGGDAAGLNSDRPAACNNASHDGTNCLAATERHSSCRSPLAVVIAFKLSYLLACPFA